MTILGWSADNEGRLPADGVQKTTFHAASDVRVHNRAAWDRNVEQGDRWTIPATAAAVNSARQGRLELLLTPTKTVPASWFGSLAGTPVLCLASGGGQQGPLLAAAGAKVVVFDNSPRQLQQDRLVAQREGLQLETVEGDMADLSIFADDTFEMIFHPCSNCFVPQVRPVWKECFRVLRAGGVLLAGFCNPVRYIFEDSRLDNGVLTVRYSIPHSDVEDLTEAERDALIVEKMEPLEFGHTLDDQIGGQIDAGFVLTGFYEDRYEGEENDPISRYLATFIATRAVKA